MRETAFTAAGDQIRWLDTNGDDDAGTAVRVFIHGLGGTLALATATASHPALGHRRSLLVDVPGHGLSDRPADFGYTLEEHARAVAAVLDAERLRGVELVGHSMGGSIAIVLAAHRPELVARLVVIEANLDPLPPSTTGLGSQRISSMTEEEWVATGYDHLIATEPDWRPTLRLCGAAAVHRSAVGLITGSRPTMRELLIGLTIPRTFIRGDRGEELREPTGLEAAGVRVVILEDSGHMVMLDQPDNYARVVAAALARES